MTSIVNHQATKLFLFLFFALTLAPLAHGATQTLTRSTQLYENTYQTVYNGDAFQYNLNAGSKRAFYYNFSNFPNCNEIQSITVLPNVIFNSTPLMPYGFSVYTGAPPAAYQDLPAPIYSSNNIWNQYPINIPQTQAQDFCNNAGYIVFGTNLPLESPPYSDPNGWQIRTNNATFTANYEPIPTATPYYDQQVKTIINSQISSYSATATTKLKDIIPIAFAVMTSVALVFFVLKSFFAFKTNYEDFQEYKERQTQINTSGLLDKHAFDYVSGPYEKVQDFSEYCKDHGLPAPPQGYNAHTGADRYYNQIT